MKIAFKDFSLETIVLGSLRLDGGAMFGSIPKNLWSRSIASDEENCIPLVTRSLLIRHSNRTILVDAGMGTKWHGKPAKIFAVNNRAPETLPFEPEAITDIVLTHLHFDHCGGISYLDGDTIKPTFPNAQIHVQKTNLENALQPNQREAASYLKENVHTVRDSDTNLVDGPTTLFDGISVELAHGHTRGLQWLLLRDGTTTVAFPSDLIPTAHHVPLPYVMGYDMCAETSLNEKAQFLDRAVTESWYVIYQHDKDTACSKIAQDDRGRYLAVEKAGD